MCKQGAGLQLLTHHNVRCSSSNAAAAVAGSASTNTSRVGDVEVDGQYVQVVIKASAVVENVAGTAERPTDNTGDMQRWAL